MNRGLIKAAVASGVLALAACGGVSTRELAGRSILTGEANVRHVYFIPRSTAAGDQGVICVEPMPDVALARTVGLSGEGAGGGLGTDATAEAKFEYATAVVQLAGRTQSVVLARDILFRACLDRANGFLKEGETFLLYTSTLALVRELGAADRNAAAAQAARAGVPTSTLGWGDERTSLVDRVAGALIGKSPAQRQELIERAIPCAQDDYGCLAGLKEVKDAPDLTALRIAVDQLATSKIEALGKVI
jgi:hypothetical protein